MKASLAGLSPDEISKIVVAYEPVWAIGTGKVASAADAQEVCKAVRDTLAELASAEIAQAVRVLYGGSVNAKNVGELIAQPDIDGGLVGGPRSRRTSSRPCRPSRPADRSRDRVVTERCAGRVAGKVTRPALLVDQGDSVQGQASSFSRSSVTVPIVSPSPSVR